MSAALAAPTPSPSIARRIDALDWSGIAADLDAQGSAVIPGLLTATECER